LSRYSTVILPYDSCVSESQLSALLAFAEQGGHVITIGYPSRDEDFAPLRMSFRDAFSTQQLDSQLHYLNPWSSWELDTMSSTLVNTAKSGLRPLLALADSLLTTDAPSTVGVYQYTMQDAITVFLVNFDYSPTTDSTRHTGSFSLTIDTVGLSDPVTAVLHSSELENPIDLPFSRSGSEITLSVPGVQYWGIIEIR